MVATAGRVIDGIPTAHPQTQAGAAAAAGAYVQVWSDRRQFDPAFQDAVERLVAGGALRAELDDTGWGAVTGGTAEPARLAEDPAVVRLAVPAGYRIDHFTSERAVVTVWYAYMQMGGVDTGPFARPASSWLANRITLAWADGSWKNVVFEEADGPVPPTGTGEGATPANARAINGFTPYLPAAVGSDR